MGFPAIYSINMKNEKILKLCEIKDYPNIDKKDVIVKKEMLKQKFDLNVSKKLRESDSVFIGGSYKKIFSLIELDPIGLWNHIHTRGNKTSLVRTAYAKLKMAVSKIDPSLIEANSKKLSFLLAKKRLNKEANNGILGSPESKFHK